MNTIAPLKVSRRRFLQGSAATAGSLVVGFHVPFLKSAEAAEGASPEVNA